MGSLSDKKVVAIIQAHMSSERLPKKIMMDLCGESVLYRLVERMRQSRHLTDIVIATSDLPVDDIIVEKCSEWGVHTFRGSDSDVLSRYWGAACQYPADIYVRLTSDNALNDPEVIDSYIEYFEENDYRYVRGDGKMPIGIGCEVFTEEILAEAAEKATEPFEHEHVTPYMYWKQTSIGLVPSERDASCYRVTLDTPADYEMICAVYKALYRPGNDFRLKELLAFLDAHPEIASINSQVVQKAVK